MDPIKLKKKILSKLASNRNSNYVTVVRCVLKVSHLWHDYRSNYWHKRDISY